MLAVLSPARNMFDTYALPVQPQRPKFLQEAQQIVRRLADFSPYALEELLDLNEERAFQMFGRYQSLDLSAGGIPALLCYDGAAYYNMQARAFSVDEFLFAQEHLRIFSALYGILAPLDGIVPHRFGIKKEFSIDGRDIYAFWGDKIYKALFEPGQLVINLASGDYTRLFKGYMQPFDRMITCRFLLKKQGQPPRGTVSTVRAARGQMARFIVKERIDRPEDLKEFDLDGYRFMPHMSSGTEYVFVLDKTAAE